MMLNLYVVFSTRGAVGPHACDFCKMGLLFLWVSSFVIQYYFNLLADVCQNSTSHYISVVRHRLLCGPAQVAVLVITSVFEDDKICQNIMFIFMTGKREGRTGEVRPPGMCVS